MNDVIRLLHLIHKSQNASSRNKKADEKKGKIDDPSEMKTFERMGKSEVVRI